MLGALLIARKGNSAFCSVLVRQDGGGGGGGWGDVGQQWPVGGKTRLT